MPVYQSALLLLALIALAMFMLRFVYWSVDREFRNLARAASDGEFRGDEIGRVDRFLDGALPLPPDVRPLPRPGRGGIRFLVSALLAVGFALLWGGAFAEPEHRRLWFHAGLAAVAIPVVYAFVTLRRRKRQRIAALLRYRADLRRIEGDRASSCSDLTELVKLTPWDDAAWAEMAEDLAELGRLSDARLAMNRAVELDPDYPEYAYMEMGFALRLEDGDRAEQALARWTSLSGDGVSGSAGTLYAAAVKLCRGDNPGASELLDQALAEDSDGVGELLAGDRALARLAAFADSGEAVRIGEEPALGQD